MYVYMYVCMYFKQEGIMEDDINGGRHLGLMIEACGSCLLIVSLFLVKYEAR